MASIQLKNVVKRFDNGTLGVDQVNLDIHDGQLLVLVGPSGCGKSTTLRMIAGLETPTSGQILIGGRDVTDLPPARRDIAMVFQNYALYPHMTVQQNLGFGLRMRKTPRREIRQRVKEVAGLLGIEELLDRRPAQLSGGQRQRVAVGRAIVRRPAAFLLDEPLSNLDARLRSHTRMELADLHRRFQSTMVYVTHDQTEAMTLGQVIAVMDRGRVQQFGAPMDLYHQPANRFVAGFLGSPPMNFIDGDSDGQQFAASSFRFPLSVSAELDPAVACHVATLGFRPEHVRTDGIGVPLASDRPLEVERLGNETMVYFRVAGQTCVARIPGDRPFENDRRMDLRVPIESTHLFDRDGNRIGNWPAPSGD